MGSFSFSCAISGLPIERGDHVRYTLVTQAPREAWHAIHIADVWSPRYWPLRAVYNDYGSVEKIEEGAAKDSWLDSWKLDVIERDRGENPVHDVPVTKDMTWDAMLEAAWEGRIYVRGDVPLASVAKDPFEDARAKPKEKNDISKGLKVEQMMIREDVWLSLSALPFEPDFHSRPVGLDVHLANAKASWERLTTPEPKLLDRLPESEVLKRQFQEAMRLVDELRDDVTFRDAHYGSLGLGTAFKLVARRYREGKMKETEVKSFLEGVADFTYLHQLLDAARHLWRPSSAAGPQFGEWKLHRRMMEEFHAIALGKEKEDEDDDE
jgi:hypothetical protein